MSAAIQVLHTTELLEQILINVTDPKTLLLAQRVDKFWSEVIGKDSLKLQKKLFFEPATHEEVVSLCMIPTYDEIWAETCGKYNLYPFVHLKHLCNNRIEELSPSISFARYNPLVIGDVLSLTLSDKLRAPVGNGSVTPSWTRMLISQPPIAKIEEEYRSRLDYLESGTLQQIRHLPAENLSINGRAAPSKSFENALQWEQEILPDELWPQSRHSSLSSSSEDESDYDENGYYDEEYLNDVRYNQEPQEYAQEDFEE
ncbi:uncharacterized protein RCC_02108 [Ramularia collo-cygni]|uniref:F-box domain-containing protein n=1 Tax=Ramularia collo-cygni TaxID=112498 RepID=A0A2D3UYK1_9PEZI|nr:uncharacterized protein RCC_02108 [Ramularia collo-cygni]CZT16266.1 uncharacterized protein RCC_02108 [Ramularia collo-cygni]